MGASLAGGEYMLDRSSAGKTVLVVGESAERRQVCDWLAMDSRLTVVQAVENGLIALEELADVAPDLIILDLAVPGVAGLGFVHMARAKTRARILIQSPLAPAGSTRAAQSLSLGADAVMSLSSGRGTQADREECRAEFMAVVYSLLDLDPVEPCR